MQEMKTNWERASRSLKQSREFLDQPVEENTFYGIQSTGCVRSIIELYSTLQKAMSPVSYVYRARRFEASSPLSYTFKVVEIAKKYGY
jgi:hypothetical protein